MAEGGSPGSLAELDPDGTPTAKACILGCGLLRPPDPDGDDPKRSDPDPKPEAEPDPKPDVEEEGNPRPDAFDDEGCGLLRPDPDGDDPKRSDPEGDPDPKPEAEADPNPDNFLTVGSRSGFLL